MTVRRLLVTGATGFVGGYVCDRAAADYEVFAPPRGALTPERVRAFRPEAVIHLAAMTSRADCPRHPAAAEEATLRLSTRLAEASAESVRVFVNVSTDLVFDGTRGHYSERDETSPTSVYGASKVAAEHAVRDALGDRAVTARLALVYGVASPGARRPSFAETMIRRARNGEPTTLCVDEFRSPIYVEDAARGLLLLAEQGPPGPVVHLGGPERCSRHEMGVAALEVFGLPGALARNGSAAEAESLVPRPRDVSLDVSLARGMGLETLGLRGGFERFRDRMARYSPG